MRPPEKAAVSLLWGPPRVCTAPYDPATPASWLPEGARSGKGGAGPVPK